MAIDPQTTVGAVSLTVRDLGRVAEFYERAVGLERIAEGEATIALGSGGEVLVALVGDPAARPRPRRTTGLYHLALLVPDRAELARALRRLIAARRRLVGAADHLVSEAIYLEDPEGNGIEIYRDRPRGEWRRDGAELAMATLPLDLESVLDELDPDAPVASTIAPGTRMGHVHLQVAELAAAEGFYAGLLGFDVTARGYPGALFLSAGGYHHHIGLNVWAGTGAPAPPSGSTGLRRFEVVLPTREAVQELAAEAGRAGGDGEGPVVLRDPSQNEVALTALE